MHNGFFTPTDQYSSGHQWEAYGIEHLTWLGIMALIIIISSLLFRKLSEDKQSRILKAIAIWIVIQEILKDIIYWAIGGLELGHLPLHICGISIFFTLWYAYRPGKLNGAYIYGMSLPGALSALIFPDWTNLPLFHFSSLNSFTIHGELVLFAILVLTSGRLRPDIKKLPKLLGVMVLMAVPIYFLNKKWDTNFMFINTPSPGSPLIPLYSLFGDGYVIALVVLVIIIWVIMFLPWAIHSHLASKNSNASTNN